MLRLVVGAGLHYEYLRTASSIWVWLLAAPIMPMHTYAQGLTLVLVCHQSCLRFGRSYRRVGPEFGPDVTGKPAQSKTGHNNFTQLT